MKKFFSVFCVLLMTIAMALPAVADEDKVLNIYCWSEYLPQDALEQFSEETGIKVKYTSYESNEAMYAKLKLLDGKGYDIVVPSTYFITLMREQGLLAPIDKTLLPNLKNIDESMLGLSFDPKNEYSIPYMWGSTSLMVNTNYVDPAIITSWKDLLRDEFKGKLILSDDQRDGIGIGLLANGYSLNSRNEDEIKKAYDFLVALYPSVRVFDLTATKQAFISEEVVIGQCFNGDAVISAQENPALKFIYPKEGALLWADSFAIPKNAEHKANAHKFMDFMMRPEIAKMVVEEFLYSTPNKEARALLPKEIQDNEAIFPPADAIKRSEMTDSVGEALHLYEEYWERLKTQM